MALCHLVNREQDAVTSAREIADEHRMPSSVLMNVLKSLTQAGLIQSVRGANGGYSLALAAEDISLAAVVEAVEGPVRFVQCAGEEDTERPPCDLACSCAIKNPLLRIHERLKEFFDEITVADLAVGEVAAAIGPLALTRTPVK